MSEQEKDYKQKKKMEQEPDIRGCLVKVTIKIKKPFDSSKQLISILEHFFEKEDFKEKRKKEMRFNESELDSLLTFEGLIKFVAENGKKQVRISPFSNKHFNIAEENLVYTASIDRSGANSRKLWNDFKDSKYYFKWDKNSQPKLKLLKSSPEKPRFIKLDIEAKLKTHKRTANDFCYDYPSQNSANVTENIPYETRKEFVIKSQLDKIIKFYEQQLHGLKSVSLPDAQAKSVRKKMKRELVQLQSYRLCSKPSSWECFFGQEGQKNKDLKILANEFPQLLEVEVSYFPAKKIVDDLKEFKLAHGRLYSYAKDPKSEKFYWCGLQLFSNETRVGITSFDFEFPKGAKKQKFRLYKDIDIDNCFPVFILEMVERIRHQGPEILTQKFPTLEQYVSKRNHFIEGMQEHYSHQKPCRQEKGALTASPDSDSSFSDTSSSTSSNGDLDSSFDHLEDTEEKNRRLEVYFFDSSPGTSPTRETCKKFFLSQYFGGRMNLIWYNHHLILKVCGKCSVCLAEKKKEEERRKKKQEEKRKKGKSPKKRSVLQKSRDCETKGNEECQAEEKCQAAWKAKEEISGLSNEIDVIKAEITQRDFFLFQRLSAERKASSKKKFFSVSQIEQKLEKQKRRTCLDKNSSKLYQNMNEEERKQAQEKKRSELEKREATKLEKNFQNATLSFTLASLEREAIKKAVEILENADFKIDCLIHDGFLVRNVHLISPDTELALDASLSKNQPVLNLTRLGEEVSKGRIGSGIRFSEKEPDDSSFEEKLRILREFEDAKDNSILNDNQNIFDFFGKTPLKFQDYYLKIVKNDSKEYFS